MLCSRKQRGLHPNEISNKENERRNERNDYFIIVLLKTLSLKNRINASFQGYVLKEKLGWSRSIMNSMLIVSFNTIETYKN
jgi:hypothetical protein